MRISTACRWTVRIWDSSSLPQPGDLDGPNPPLASTPACFYTFANEYLANFADGWQTAIGSFKIPTCGNFALFITKTADTNVIEPNDAVTCKIIDGNNGAGTAYGVVLTETVPVYAAFTGPNIWHDCTPGAAITDAHPYARTEPA